jgi:anti-anti-sigma factor
MPHHDWLEPFSVDVVGPVDGISYVFVRGELDLSSAPALEERLLELDGSHVLLDLGELAFIDSTGLRVLLGADQRARAAGRSFRLTPGRPEVMRAFRCVGLADQLWFVGLRDGETHERQPQRRTAQA